MTKRLFGILGVALSLFWSTAVRGDEVVLDFDALPEVECGDSWEMEGLSVSLMTSTDCTSYHTPYGYYMASTCLDIDIRPLTDLHTVIVDFVNYGEPDDFFVYLMNLNAPVVEAYSLDPHSRERLVLSAADPDIERIRIGRGAFLLHSVTCRYGPVHDETSAWGSIKTMFR